MKVKAKKVFKKVWSLVYGVVVYRLKIKHRDIDNWSLVLQKIRAYPVAVFE